MGGRQWTDVGSHVSRYACMWLSTVFTPPSRSDSISHTYLHNLAVALGQEALPLPALLAPPHTYLQGLAAWPWDRKHFPFLLSHTYLQGLAVALGQEALPLCVPAGAPKAPRGQRLARRQGLLAHRVPRLVLSDRGHLLRDNIYRVVSSSAYEHAT